LKSEALNLARCVDWAGTPLRSAAKANRHR